MNSRLPVELFRETVCFPWDADSVRTQKIIHQLFGDCCVGASSGLGVTLYDQPWNGTAGGSLSQPGFTFYDNFTLATTEAINNVIWTGNRNGGTLAGFTIGFYASSSGAPGSLLQSFVIAGNASETFLSAPGGFPAFSYSANLAPSFNALGGTEYWISIAANITGGSWGWSGGSGGDGESISQNTGGGRTIVPSDLAFTLNGPNANGNGVPESANTALLLGTAVVALGFFRCRRQRDIANFS